MNNRWGIGLLVVAALVSGGCKKKKPSPNPNDDRATRLMAAGVIAPPAVGPPLAGPEGVDADGYPTQYVDRGVLRGMFARKEYAELTKTIEGFQDAFEADPKRELWPIDGGDAFASAEKELDAGIEEWIAATPKSFVPYLVRGVHRFEVAFAQRGDKFIRETRAADLGLMTATMGPTKEDLQTALSLRPKLLAAQIRLFLVARFLGDDLAAKKAIGDALAASPTSFRVRASTMRNSGPRWGQTYPDMIGFAQKAVVQNPSFPRMKLLVGYVDYDKARTMEEAGDPAHALPIIERACALGDYWDFLLRRGIIERDAKDYPDSLADLERAAVLRPDFPAILIQRAYSRSLMKNDEGALSDLRRVLLIEPTNSTIKAYGSAILKGVYDRVVADRDQGRKTEALRLLQLALEIAPYDPDLHAIRDSLVLAGSPGSGSEADLRADVQRNPDVFEPHLRLDTFLSKQGRFADVIDMWTPYIDAHPEDGHALLERGGAYYNIHRLAEAKADSVKSCNLGVSEGCRSLQLFK